MEAARVGVVEQLFAGGGQEEPLRCTMHAIEPALNYSFRFQTGYMIDTPLEQFRGPGHELTVWLRVTPDGRKPVYLTKSEKLPDVPANRLDAESTGTLVVGEGSYRVDAILADDRHRVCRGGWKMQARRGGAARQLILPTPPSAVEELSGPAPFAVPPRAGPRIGRLTILLHAASPVPGRARLQADEVERLTGTVGSVMFQMPARSVRLIAFNLDQRAVLLRQDGFQLNQLGDLAAAIEKLELAKVDVRTLQLPERPIDLLAGLLRLELEDPKPADAVIVIGPRSRRPLRDAKVPQIHRSVTVPPVFYLRFELISPAVRTMRSAPIGMADLSDAQTNRPYNPVISPMPMPAPMPSMMADAVTQLMASLKAETIFLDNPQGLARAIRRMDSRIVKTVPAAGG